MVSGFKLPLTLTLSLGGEGMLLTLTIGGEGMLLTLTLGDEGMMLTLSPVVRGDVVNPHPSPLPRWGEGI